MKYIKQMDNFDFEDISNLCISSGLYEEAYESLMKGKKYSQAVTLLTEQLHDLPRAFALAERLDDLEVWRAVGKAQMRLKVEGKKS